MARIPNTTDANGVWDLNQQRNAAYGQVWPPTHVPPTPWAGDRYFSYSGFGSGGSGGYQLRYEYCNSVTLAVAWGLSSTHGVSMNWYQRYNYTGKMSNLTRIVNAGGLPNFGGGSAQNWIYYLTAATFGYSTNWGTVAPYAFYGGRGGSDGTTGIYGGGYNTTSAVAASTKNKITIATTGTSTAHGNLYGTREQAGSASGATYFCTFGGSPWSTGQTNWDYETFATGGTSALAGNLEAGTPRYNYNCDAIDGGLGSSRIVLAGGAWQYGGHSNAMFHYTTASFGVGTDYGNMANAREANSTTGNGTYGVIAGGSGSSAYESGTLIFNVGTLGLATVGANALNYGVTTNGAGVGNQ